MRRAVWILPWLLLSVTPAAWATEYFVSTTGNNMSAGTSEGTAWRTIDHAARVVNPGDIVTVIAGSYVLADADGTCGSDTIVCINRSGTAGNSILFRSQAKWGAKIYGQTNTANVGIGFISDASYVTIQDFEIYSTATQGISNNTTLGIGNQFRGNLIHDISDNICTSDVGGRNGILNAARGTTIAGNVFHTIGRLANGESGCSNSTDFRNHDHGIYLCCTGAADGANDVAIYNNLFYNLVHGWGVQFQARGNTGTCLVANNTFAFENPGQPGQIIINQSLNDCVIENNVFYDPQTMPIVWLAGSYSNIIVRTNIASDTAFSTVYYQTSTSLTGVTQTSNLVTPPLLMSVVVPYDFSLAASSPAIDTGTTVATYTTDINGLLRPQPVGGAYDMGAYERGPSGTPVDPPSTVQKYKWRIRKP
jgi:hypothetical protein